jgi:alpha-ribazole phosphatase
MRLLALRHPPTLAPPELCVGRLDIACDDAEIDRAVERWCAQLAAPAPQRVFASPLLRCRQPAERLAARLQVPCTVDDDLMEAHFGAWEGRRWSEIAQHEIDAWVADFGDAAPGGGESVRQVLARVERWLGRVQAQHRGQTCVAVTHAGVIGALAWLMSPHDGALPSARQWPPRRVAHGELVAFG